MVSQLVPAQFADILRVFDIPSESGPANESPLTRRPIVAPSSAVTALVRKAMIAFPNTAENVPTRDEWVTASASLKSSGISEDEHADWSLDYPGNTEDDARKLFESIHDTTVGPDYFFALAKAHGFDDGTAQDDFATPVDDAAMHPTDVRPAPVSKKLRFLLLSQAAALPDPEDFVEGFICDGQLSVLLGKPGAGKSFFALCLGFAVALGLPFFGRQVNRGGVVYVAAEGGGGVKNRLAAQTGHLGPHAAAASFALVPETINFRDRNAVEAFVLMIFEISEQLGWPIRLIFIDTFARALAGGDENSSTDVGSLIRNVDYIREKTGAHVMLIAHQGKDGSKGIRGHSSLLGAIDTEILVERQANGKNVSEVTITKQRDLEIGAGFAFALRQIPLGTDRRGKPITSCVVEAVSVKPSLTETEQEAMALLNTLLFEAPGVTVPVASWRKVVLSADNLLTGQAPDARGKQWQRLRDGLKNKGIVEISGDQVGLRSL